MLSRVRSKDEVVLGMVKFFFVVVGGVYVLCCGEYFCFLRWGVGFRF